MYTLNGVDCKIYSHFCASAMYSSIKKYGHTAGMWFLTCKNNLFAFWTWGHLCQVRITKFKNKDLTNLGYASSQTWTWMPLNLGHVPQLDWTYSARYGLVHACPATPPLPHMQLTVAHINLIMYTQHTICLIFQGGSSPLHTVAITPGFSEMQQTKRYL